MVGDEVVIGNGGAEYGVRGYVSAYAQKWSRSTTSSTIYSNWPNWMLGEYLLRWKANRLVT